ncbi:unnamed protein product [Sphagnum tenellum]
MITTPSGNGWRQPCCNATDVVQFFRHDAAKIFPTRFMTTRRLRWVLEGAASVFGPIYSATPLEVLLLAKFRTTCLSEALTSVIIPAFDTVNEIPVFFSNLRGVDRAEPLYNVHVTDACRATTAVPIFFPAATFQEVPGAVNRRDGPRVFNVIDGGIAVNDPTLVAVAQAIAKRRPGARTRFDFLVICLCFPQDFRNVLVLSLAAGQHPMRFVARPHSSSVEWLVNSSGLPLLSSFFSASADMVEYYTSMIFDAHQSGHHYLRIQTDCLPTSQFWGIDDATPQNLQSLTGTARNLLNSPVSKRNFATGRLQAVTNGGNNREALQRFARWLVDERRERRRQPQPDRGPAVRACSSMMGAATLVVVCFAVLIMYVASKYVKTAPRI